MRAFFVEGLTFGFECASGADADALAAEDAGCVGHCFVLEGGDGCVEATAIEVERVGELCVVGTNLDATPAVDALVVVTDVEGVVVHNFYFASLAAFVAVCVCAVDVH